jgi:hypothetical protein
MSFPDLIIGGIRVPRHACLDLDQSYEDIVSAELLRLGNGDGLIQTADWGKIRTTINCSGWLSSGLNGINWKDPAGVAIACVEPRSIIAVDNIISIPGTIRDDHPVTAFALIGNEEVPTEVSVLENTATLVEVDDATAYMVRWLPVLTCFCAGGIRSSYTTSGNEFSWSLNGEEL